MKRFMLLLLVSLAILITLPSISQEAKGIDKLKIRIQEMNDKMAEASVAGDFEMGAKYYAEDVIYMPNYDKTLRGIEELRAHEKEMLESGMKVLAMDIKAMEVRQEGDIVYEIGKYAITLSIPESPMPINDYGKYLTIWEMTGKDEMKIIVEIWNTDMNPWRMYQQFMEEKKEGVKSSGVEEEKEEQKGGVISKSGEKTEDEKPETEKK